MTRFDLVIFDCDGVLVDSESISNQVVVDIANRHGAQLTLKDTLDAFVGLSVDGVRDAIREMAGVELPPDWSAVYYAELLPALARSVKAILGVHDVLTILQRAGQPFCVASQGPPEKMHTTLTATGLLSFFEDRMFSAKTVKRPKPAPDLFLHAARHFDAEPARCAVVEDSMTGIAAAIAAEMMPYFYCPSTEAAKTAGRGAHPFHNMNDLPRLLFA